MKCTLCKRELPETEFYPSTIKKGLKHCKQCCYERWGKKNNKKYSESIKRLPEKDFNRYYGGFKISILNYVRKGEYKYHIDSTDGYIFNTNKTNEFISALKNILDVH